MAPNVEDLVAMVRFIHERFSDDRDEATAAAGS